MLENQALQAAQSTFVINCNVPPELTSNRSENELHRYRRWPASFLGSPSERNSSKWNLHQEGWRRRGSLGPDDSRSSSGAYLRCAARKASIRSKAPSSYKATGWAVLDRWTPADWCRIAKAAAQRAFSFRGQGRSPSMVGPNWVVARLLRTAFGDLFRGQRQSQSRQYDGIAFEGRKNDDDFNGRQRWGRRLCSHVEDPTPW